MSRCSFIFISDCGKHGRLELASSIHPRPDQFRNHLGQPKPHQNTGLGPTGCT